MGSMTVMMLCTLATQALENSKHGQQPNEVLFHPRLNIDELTRRRRSTSSETSGALGKGKGKSKRWDSSMSVPLEWQRQEGVWREGAYGVHYLGKASDDTTRELMPSEVISSSAASFGEATHRRRSNSDASGTEGKGKGKSKRWDASTALPLEWQIREEVWREGGRDLAALKEKMKAGREKLGKGTDRMHMWAEIRKWVETEKDRWHRTIEQLNNEQAQGEDSAEDKNPMVRERVGPGEDHRHEKGSNTKHFKSETAEHELAPTLTWGENTREEQKQGKASREGHEIENVMGQSSLQTEAKTWESKQQDFKSAEAGREIVQTEALELRKGALTREEDQVETSMMEQLPSEMESKAWVTPNSQIKGFPQEVQSTCMRGIEEGEEKKHRTLIQEQNGIRKGTGQPPLKVHSVIETKVSDPVSYLERSGRQQATQQVPSKFTWRRTKEVVHEQTMGKVDGEGNAKAVRQLQKEMPPMYAEPQAGASSMQQSKSEGAEHEVGKAGEFKQDSNLHIAEGFGMRLQTEMQLQGEAKAAASSMERCKSKGTVHEAPQATSGGDTEADCERSTVLQALEGLSTTMGQLKAEMQSLKRGTKVEASSVEESKGKEAAPELQRATVTAWDQVSASIQQVREQLSDRLPNRQQKEREDMPAKKTIVQST
eukprot:gnl/MRDRNA2_/MRDRNA2_82249_c0_seq3.p1 gnl/MRDRNA2_/MRDRNA2_82249_c0~~gnl/MRDRNA2_/MRDRNA2_82249_c0_seq3.p1  ORF type:complete len:657 (+),score=161.97 gnl/MRDRNA2_/MRDRNA2_82249_c0_seq3:140-2110(+)